MLQIEDGYFVHFFTPESLPVIRKHLVFVLDYSGSMAEYKREQISIATIAALKDLNPSDYFSLILFSEKAAVSALNCVPFSFHTK